MMVDMLRQAVADMVLVRGYMPPLEGCMPLQVQDCTVLQLRMVVAGCMPDWDNSCCFTDEYTVSEN